MELERMIWHKNKFGYFKLVGISMGSMRIKFCNSCMRMVTSFIDYGDDGLLGMLEMYLALKERKDYDFVAYDGSNDYWVFRIKNYTSGYYLYGPPFEHVVFSVQSGWWHEGIEHGAFFYQEFPVEYLEALFEKLFKDVLKHPNFPQGYNDYYKLREPFIAMLTDLKVPEGWHARRLEDIPALVETRKKLFNEIQ